MLRVELDLVPVHTQWVHTAKFHNEIIFLDFPGQTTIDVFKQNFHSEMIQTVAKRVESE